MKITKRVLALVLCICLIAGLCAVGAGAENPVAQIGDTTYATLADAAAAAQSGDTVKLLANTDISASGLIISSELTLDLNGHELKAANTDAGNIDVADGGNLTLIDSTDTEANGGGSGKLYSETDYSSGATGFCIISVTGTGCFTMDSGYLYAVRPDAENKGQFAVSAKGTATVTINGGKIEAGWYAVSGNGSVADQNTTINITGGYLVSTADYSLYIPQAGTVNISGGTIYGAAGGIAMNRGTLNMTGGLVTSRGVGNTGSWGDGTGSLSNAAVYLNARYGDVSAAIHGGYLSAAGDAVMVKTGTAHTSTLAISGGKFSSNPGAYVGSGLFVLPNADDDSATYPYLVSSTGAAEIGDTQYSSVQAAVTAAKSGDTVTMNHSSVEDVVIPSGKTVTLDLNGMTLTGKTAAASKAMTSGETGVPFIQAAITNAGTLTVTGSGTVRAAGKYDAALFNKADAAATLNGGTFTDALAAGGCWYIVVNLGDMTINDGTAIENQNPAKTSDTALINGVDQQLVKGEVLGGYTQTKNAGMTINGGTFTSGLFVVKNGDWYAQMTINDGSFAAMNSHVNGCVISNANNCPMNVKGGSFTASGSTPVIKCKNKTAFVGIGTGSGLLVSGGTFAADTDGDAIQTITKTGSEGENIAPILNITGGNFLGTFNANIQSGTAAKTSALSLSGGCFTADPGAFTAAGFQAVSGSWPSGGRTYAYKVVEVPKTVNKIESVSAQAYSDDTTVDTGANIAASLGSSKITVSGKAPAADSKVVVTYRNTDGTTGTITIAKDAGGAFIQPASVTVGNTTYTVNISGLSVLPAEVQTAAPAVEPVPDTSDSAENPDAAKAAIDAINNASDTISADGLGAAAADTVATTSGGTTTVPVGDASGNAAAQTVGAVIESAQGTSEAPAAIKNADPAELVVVVQPVIQIEVNDAVTDSNGNQAIVLDISAFTQAIVATKDAASDPDTALDGTNSVKVGEPAPMVVSNDVTLTIPVPAGFITEQTKNQTYIQHKMHNDKLETVRVTPAGSLVTGVSTPYYPAGTFTVHGLSPIILVTDARTAAVEFKNADGTPLATIQFTPADVGKTAFPAAAAPSGQYQTGWSIDGTVYALGTVTDAILTALNGKTAAAEPVFADIPAATSSPAATCTLSFNTNGGSAVAPVIVARGAAIGLAAYVPTRSGYTFGGWYSDSALTNAVTSITLDTDAAVYAKWTAVSINPFKDVNAGDYFFNAVQWAFGKNIATGLTASAFAPNAACTRAQTVSFLWRAMGSPEPAGSSNPFKDVSSDAYYCKAVLWAAEKGIALGTSGSTFSPNATVTRGQAVTFLWRAAGKPTASGTNPFKDVADGDYCRSAVLWAVSNGITNGTGAASFSPAAPCTRAQIITFLYRYLGK